MSSSGQQETKCNTQGVSLLLQADQLSENAGIVD